MVFIKAFIIEKKRGRGGETEGKEWEENRPQSGGKTSFDQLTAFKVLHPHSHDPSLSFIRQILLIVPFVLSSIRQ